VAQGDPKGLRCASQCAEPSGGEAPRLSFDDNVTDLWKSEMSRSKRALQRSIRKRGDEGKPPSRDPGDPIKRDLRREVNFGCPVRYPDGTGCGCPILTYHHFDPPWARHFVHVPEGMIALCKQHHDQADGGRWTASELRVMKRHPYVDDAVRVQWPYGSETLVVKAGPCLIVGRGSALRLNTRPALRFAPREIEELGTRTIAFDSEILDVSGLPWLRIEDNWFDLRLRATTDLEFPPQARTLTAKHQSGMSLSLKYVKKPAPEFVAWLARPDGATLLHTLEDRGAIDSEGNVPTLVFEGSFKTPEVEVRVTADRFRVRTLIPGFEEVNDLPGFVVDEEHSLPIMHGDEREIFRLG
jgi:hypothetical protein